MSPRKLLALRSSTVRQDCQSPDITSSKNKSVRQELRKSGKRIFLRTVDLRMNESPEIYYYARLLESPDLYWSFDELCWNEAPLRRPFLKLLYENGNENKKKRDVEILKTSNLPNKIISSPPQSHETIPLKGLRSTSCFWLRGLRKFFNCQLLF